MTIVEAIMKAKQMGQAHAGAAKSAPGRAQARNSSNGRSSASRVDAPVPQSIIDRPVFPVLSYDEATCASSHIVALTSDLQLSQSASPPYRMLRARLLQRCRDNAWTTLAISSPGPGEGKSVTALNLALTVAREGNYDVFLLDLDLRKPSLCRYLGVKPNCEISSYFAGTAEVRDVFFALAGVERLSIAGGTLSVHHASEMLASGYLEELIEYIKSISVKPLILIDLPPILNTDDTLVVAPHVDATILVASEGITRRDSLVRAVAMLAEFPVAGIALNRASVSIGAEYYGP